MSGKEGLEEGSSEEEQDPQTLAELFEYIWSRQPAISQGVASFAVGWIFYDIFERAEKESKNTGRPCSSADLDRFVQEMSADKIDRLIYDAEQRFGSYASDFMEADTKIRIQKALDDGVVGIVRGYTSGAKTFFWNVAAGVVAGIIFAAVSLGLYFYVKVDPSANAIGKAEMHQGTQ